MKTFLGAVFFVSSLAFGFEPLVEEVPVAEASLIEVNHLEKPIYASPSLTLSIQYRKGAKSHATSFALCTIGKDYCQTFWIVKAKEQLRCETVRYTAQSVDHEKTLIVDESSARPGCEVVGVKWNAHLFDKGTLAASFRGFPHKVR